MTASLVACFITIFLLLVQPLTAATTDYISPLLGKTIQYKLHLPNKSTESMEGRLFCENGREFWKVYNEIQ